MTHRNRLSHACLFALLAASANAQDYSTGLGTWRGPVQFNLLIAAQRDASAHAIAPMVVEIASDGTVRGISTDAGCRFSGLARQMSGPNVWTLDVTAKGCNDRRFDQRYSGTLGVYAGTKQAQLSLRWHQIPLLGRQQMLGELSAVLKR